MSYQGYGDDWIAWGSAPYTIGVIPAFFSLSQAEYNCDQLRGTEVTPAFLNKFLL